MTEVCRVQQTMGQERTQTDREGQNVCFDLLLLYLSLLEGSRSALKPTSYSCDTKY